MMLYILGQVSPAQVDVAVNHVEKQPWIAVVAALGGICAVMIAGLIWYAKSQVPAQRAEREKERAERQAEREADRQHLTGLLAARGKESERDMAQVTEVIAIKLDNRMTRVEESVNRHHESLTRVGDSVQRVQSDLAKILAKAGATLIVCMVLFDIYYSLLPSKTRKKIPLQMYCEPYANDRRPLVSRGLDFVPDTRAPGLPVYSIVSM